jgi:hypothetical protein
MFSMRSTKTTLLRTIIAAMVGCVLAVSTSYAQNARAGVRYGDGNVINVPFLCDTNSHTIVPGGVSGGVVAYGPASYTVFGTTLPAGYAYYMYWVLNTRTGAWVHQSTWLQPGSSDGGVYVGAGLFTQYKVYVRYARWINSAWSYWDEYTTDFSQAGAGSSQVCFA